MTTNNDHLRQACEALLAADKPTQDLLDDVEAGVALVRFEMRASCDHADAQKVYEDDKQTLVVDAAGQPVRFCTICLRPTAGEW